MNCKPNVWRYLLQQSNLSILMQTDWQTLQFFLQTIPLLQTADVLFWAIELDKKKNTELTEILIYNCMILISTVFNFTHVKVNMSAVSQHVKVKVLMAYKEAIPGGVHLGHQDIFDVCWRLQIHRMTQIH